MDGNPRAVKKYAQLYESLGFRVLILIATSSHFMGYPISWVHSYTAKLIRDKLNGEEDTEWVVHMMSNGGCRSWYCFEKNYQTPLKVKAMIFDSAPSKFDPDREPPYHIFFPRLNLVLRLVLINLVIKPSIYIVKFASYFFNVSHPMLLHQQRFIEEQCHIPKLFLYSSKDKLVRSSDIMEVVVKARDSGTRVQSFDFVDSAHVAHFQKYATEYRKKIKQFLKEELSNDLILISPIK
jgi:hypothetical protein